MTVYILGYLYELSWSWDWLVIGVLDIANGPIGSVAEITCS